jgi:DNA-binding LytR/AlgR family response regulator
MSDGAGLRVLAVDDVAPALDELCQLLREAPGVGSVLAAGDAIGALRLIGAAPLDAVFLDISMPGMDGLELGALLARMASPPVIVFVTAFEQHALRAYRVGAVDYLLKPVAADRLADALGRVRRVRSGDPAGDGVPDGTAGGPVGAGAPAVATPVDELAVVLVELGGRARYIRRADVRFAEAHGDYVRLRTHGGSHLVRIPMARLEEHWRSAGYLRVHRGFLLAVRAVQELRSDAGGGLFAHTDAGDVPVSRRHARRLRELLLAAAARGDYDTAAARGDYDTAAARGDYDTAAARGDYDTAAARGDYDAAARGEDPPGGAGPAGGRR